MKYNHENFRPCSCCKGSGITDECRYVMFGGMGSTIYTGKLIPCPCCIGEVLTKAAFTEWKELGELLGEIYPGNK